MMNKRKFSQTMTKVNRKCGKKPNKRHTMILAAPIKEWGKRRKRRVKEGMVDSMRKHSKTSTQSSMPEKTKMKRN